MDNYLLQFLAIASAHALAVLSPGPDLLLVFQHSLVHKRPKVYYSCIGIGCGITIHTILALSGLGLLLNRYPVVNQIFVLAGAGFLLYLAYGAYRSGKFQFSAADNSEGNISRLRLWQLGFLTNALNAKAVFLFSQPIQRRHNSEHAILVARFLCGLFIISHRAAIRGLILAIHPRRRSCHPGALQQGAAVRRRGDVRNIGGSATH